MIYLLLNILLSSCFILCIKWLQPRKEDTISVGEVNYIVAALVGCLWLPTATGAPSTMAMATGATNGICYFIAFFLLLPAVRAYGATATAVVTRLSILLPILIGILFYHEHPTALQGTGVALAFCSLLLMGQARSSAASPRPHSVLDVLSLGVFCIIAGSSRVAQEVFKYQCDPSERPFFLVSAFACAGIASLVLMFWRRKFPTRSEYVIGFFLGLTNILQTFFILKALEHLDGFIVFPVTSAGGLLLTTIVAVAGLKESITGRTAMGITMAIVALTLLYS